MGSAKLGSIACLFLLFGKSVASHAQEDETYKEVFTPNKYKYISLNANGLVLQPTQTSLKFVVQARNDARIALHKNEVDISQKMYEIVIGGWGNRRSVILARKEGINWVSRQHRPLSEQEFRPFWISWKNGLIKVGTGSEVGSNEFLSLRNPSPFAINFISVSTGWGSTGQWRFASGEKVDGGWTEWSTVVSDFTASCGGGTKTISKTRTCTNPPPSNSGKDCEGLETDIDTQVCNTEECPVTADACKDSYDITYAKHPSDCSKYLRCVRGWDPAVKSCPSGTRWSQPHVTCVHANLVTCDVEDTPTIPATSCDNGKRPVQGNSQAFELHVDGQGWTWNSCPSGEEFDVAKCNCVPAADQCPNLREVPGGRPVYEQYADGHGWREMPCAPGTVSFDKPSCKCI